MSRVYTRLFDYDEARRLREEGLSWQRIADHFGVSSSAVQRACRPEIRAAMDARVIDFKMGVCEDCGGACRTNFYQKHARLDRIVCRRCSSRRRSEEALLDRLNENGDLLCRRCGEYRPMAVFVSRLNGFPRSECRACETERRRATRAKNPEHQRAYDRERMQRLRANSHVRVDPEPQEASTT